MDHFEQINETSYLSVQNAPVYRKIMRCFYREYEKMHFQLYKEDIFQFLKEDDAFELYSMEQLVQDLEALVKWKNLTPIQDPGKVYTIADYKNKQYRYTMSEYAMATYLRVLGICRGDRASDGTPGKFISGIGKSVDKLFRSSGEKSG